MPNVERRYSEAAKAAHARTIPLTRAIAWRWHCDPDRRVRLAMAARLAPDSAELASMLYDADDAVAAMAYERSMLADYSAACRDTRWLVRQVGVAKTCSLELVQRALRDMNDIVRTVAERRMFGKQGRAFCGQLRAIL